MGQLLTWHFIVILFVRAVPSRVFRHLAVFPDERCRADEQAQGDVAKGRRYLHLIVPFLLIRALLCARSGTSPAVLVVSTRLVSIAIVLAEGGAIHIRFFITGITARSRVLVISARIFVRFAFVLFEAAAIHLLNSRCHGRHRSWNRVWRDND